MYRRPSQSFGLDLFVKTWAAVVAAVLVASVASAQQAADLLKLSGVQGGLVVHLGCGDGATTGQLRTSESYLVHGLDTSDDAVTAARDRLRDQGVYGPVSVDRWDGNHLPYADGLVNSIVADDPAGASDDELLRVLAPGGVLLRRQDGRWKKTVKPWPAEIDEWTHYLHASDGNPVADDSVVGPPTRLQWIGSPRWSRHHDHMASMTSMVSAGGRLFYILDEGPRASIQLPSSWRLIARDAFNGTILWKRDIERWNTRHYPLKSGPAHLLRRLVAVGEKVYVTLGIDAPLTALDAATGETLSTYQGSEYTREIVASDGVLLLVADNAPSRLPGFRRVSTYVWENTRTANPQWGWQGNPRKILAYAADTGKHLWKTEAPVAPCSLAVAGGRAVFHDGEKLVCLDAKTGKPSWETEAAPAALPVQTNTGPRTLIYGDVVLLAAGKGKTSGYAIADGRKLWEQAQRPSGHMSLKDLMVVDGLVWTGSIAGSSDDGVMIGYDPKTGEVKRQFPPDVHVHWFHHRCYPAKASGHYLLTARNGTEFVDLDTEHWKPHHWVRGGCIYGVMPCNGMTYAPMDACGCQLEAKLSGLKALAGGPVPQPGKDGVPNAPRLEKGPAYAGVRGQGTGVSGAFDSAVRGSPDPAPTTDRRSPRVTTGRPAVAKTAGSGDPRRARESVHPSSFIIHPSEDWPTFRHDAARSGAGSTTVSGALGQAWEAKLGGRLSAPTIAAGRVFVASVDTHTVHALDAKTGKPLWALTTGGRVDSPPTIYTVGRTSSPSRDGLEIRPTSLCLFGSADGYVYAVRAEDGVLAWRFRAAPVDRRMAAWEQLESIWPVHGAVLVHDGVLYCTAGRNMFLDGGIHFLKLDPATGRLLGEEVWADKDPDSGEEMQLAYLKQTRGNVMPVALSDVLSCDGKNLWMRSQKIGFDGKRSEIALVDVNQQPADDCHLFCQIGLLDDSYFFRSYWTYGRRVSGGYGAWPTAGRLVPSGRILCFDEDHVFGFGRKPEFMTNASVLQYQIFAADKTVTPEAIARIARADREMNSRSKQKNASSSDWLVRRFFPNEDLTAARFAWLVDQPPLIARAMALTSDAVFVAGPPNVIDERKAYRMPDDPDVLANLEYQAEALDGKHGGELWEIDKADGVVQVRYQLDTIPVFDGLAAAGGRLFASTVDGRVLCLAGNATPFLPSAGGPPEPVAWEKPEDPGYLLPPEVPKNGDFDLVARCRMVESKLGYRLIATGKGQIAVALKKLDEPVTGSATLKTRIVVPANTGMLQNGYLVFGDGTTDAKLIKCGVRLKMQKAQIVEGPLQGGKARGTDIDAADGKPIDVVVHVDLSNNRVTYTANGVAVEATLQRPLKKITHVGYAAENATVDFAPLDVEMD